MALVRRGFANRWIVRAGAAGALALTFGYVPYHLYARSGFARYLELEGDLQDMQRGNAGLRADIARLTREAYALKNDPRAVEQVARHELGWVRPGDLVLDLQEGGK